MNIFINISLNFFFDFIQLISNSKISIAMAVYNAEKYIFDQLISIENPNFKKPSEIIICNDASTDQTKEIIEDFQKKSNIFIRIIDHKKNLGYHKAFETAIKNCSGIIFLFQTLMMYGLVIKLKKRLIFFKIIHILIL